MNLFRTTLVSRQEVAENTLSFFFEKPLHYDFIAGQYAGWTIPNLPNPDAEGRARTFTISSAPFEPHLSFTTRIRQTTFKQFLSHAPLGTEIQVSAPEGDFILPSLPVYKSTSLPAVVFLAAGIGITPFRSILTRVTHDHLPYKIHLFYSNHTRQDTAFLEELTTLEHQNPNFRFVPIMTQDPTWPGEKSPITPSLLTKILPSPFSNLNSVYVSGPPAFVTSLREMLFKKLRIPAESVLSDSFTGY
ncbi:MAG: Oxidoreductase FAD/NAD(P)-binding family protein [Microgenomates group bacterium GW2011_GWA1_48_10]|uniref:FAD-binding FR-type domain-containing protein n=1 Tax=Candidatus Gottesmanbacteria bacterium RIFCSPHIGHO2_01_FULL_47_48 TaxID=1798381 RepID=A0A1F6A1U4_9BACT|nr:MAG: Oxidoreductase FAD/NAD(P)-binding family protein [Microgenomates group bacterium GW2011_GWA1_48_10]OGG18442.1 MAG: hypothetical protein A2721_01495 [Candidatus Gottesmanbacteria bacterium RIFCSPHIGHO2_01_FULL_47_48]